MGLNISNGNMYSWVTHTWNTIKGKCPHDCSYCYMHKWGEQKPVRFDDKEMMTDLEMGRIIFVGSSCDMFASEIPDAWISKTIDRCLDFNNIYLFQSKNPQRFSDYLNHLYTDTRFCTTIETNRRYDKFMGNTPGPKERAYFLREWPFDRYVTIEPIMDFDLKELVEIIKVCEPKQVNIGADSGNNHLPEPSAQKVLELIDELKKFTVIDQKRNLNRILNPN
jgi:DNA repair photolyase